MRQLANDKKLATQMGNQGSAENGLRRAVEVDEPRCHRQTTEPTSGPTAPIWPQGLDRPAGEDSRARGARLGRLARTRALPPVQERGLITRSRGAVGSTSAPARWATMACHTVNMPFRALKLGYPTVVELRDGLAVLSRDLPEDLPHPLRVPERERPAAAEVLVVRRNPMTPSNRSALTPRRPAKSSPPRASCQAAARSSLGTRASSIHRMITAPGSTWR